MCDQDRERLEQIRGRFVNAWKDQSKSKGCNFCWSKEERVR